MRFSPWDPFVMDLSSCTMFKGERYKIADTPQHPHGIRATLHEPSIPHLPPPKKARTHTHTLTLVFSYTQFPDGKKGEEPQGGKVSWNSMVEHGFHSLSKNAAAKRCKAADGCCKKPVWGE